MTTARDPFEFAPEHDGTLSIEAAVFQALGAASTCWESMAGTGLFNSSRANEIGYALIARIRDHDPALAAGRTWIGEALAAFDQALTEAGQHPGFPSPDFWIARAQAAAGIAAAEQARTANLIAWKQLRQSAPASALPSAGDAIAEEIERALGITDGSTP